MSVPRPNSLAAVGLAIGIFSGCIGTTPPQSNPSTRNTDENSDASSSNAVRSLSNAEGQQPLAAAGDLSDLIPEDIYVARKHMSSRMTQIGGKQNLTLEYDVSDIESFIEAFHNGMKEQGWTLVTSSALPIGTIANFSKSDRKCTVSIAPPRDRIVKVAIMLPQEQDVAGK